MTALHTAAQTALARIDAQPLTYSVTFGWPVWADEAVSGGEANAYFDPQHVARRLSHAQRDGIPSLVALAEKRMVPPSEEARAHFAEALVGIAARVQPGMGDKATAAWASEVILSFSRTPMDLLAKAIEAARFKQFGFVSEVGPFLEAELAEPLRNRKAKIDRLRRIADAATRLAAPKPVATPEEAAAIIDEFKLRAKPVVRPADRPEIDWAAEREKKLADTNFLRALHGKPPFTMAEYQDDLALRHKQRSDLADEMSDAIEDVGL